MALNWRVGTVKNFKELCYVDAVNDKGEPDINPETNKPFVNLNPVTETIIWRMIAIMMYDITEKNAEEVYFRMSYYESLFPDAQMKKKNLDTGEIVTRWITWQDIVDHIGLGTNAGDETRLQFIKRLAENFDREHRYRLNGEKEKMEIVDDLMEEIGRKD